MKNIVDSIRLSLETSNWYSALLMALIIPDICSKIEFPKLNTNKRYPNWFEKYKNESYKKNLSGFDCYALRCAYAHEGKQVISEQKSKEVLDKITFSPNGSHLIYLSNGYFGGTNDDRKNILHLSVSKFCLDMIASYEQWSKEYHYDSSAFDSSMITITPINTIGNGAIRIE